MKTIKYSDSLKLKVTVVDNQLTVHLNQDVPEGTKAAEVYNRSVSGFATGVDDIIDLAQAVNIMDGSVILTAVVNNFAGPGGAAFELIADGQSVYKQNQNLKEYSSQQWAVAIEREY